MSSMSSNAAFQRLAGVSLLGKEISQTELTKYNGMNNINLQNKHSNIYEKINVVDMDQVLTKFVIPYRGDLVNTISLCFTIKSKDFDMLENSNYLIYKLFDKIHLKNYRNMTILKFDSDYIHLNNLIRDDEKTSYFKFIGSLEQRKQWLEEDIITLTIDLPIFKFRGNSGFLLDVEVTPLFHQICSECYLQVEYLLFENALVRKMCISTERILLDTFPKKVTIKEFSCDMLDVPYDVAKIIDSYISPKYEVIKDISVVNCIKYFIIHIKDLNDPIDYDYSKSKSKSKSKLDKLTISYNGESDSFSGHFLNKYLPSKHNIANLPENVYFYTYAQRPISAPNDQTGFCDFGRFDNIKFKFEFNKLSSYEINIYFLEYNILKSTGYEFKYT